MNAVDMACTPEARRAEHREIERMVQDFLDAGGEITHGPSTHKQDMTLRISREQRRKLKKRAGEGAC